MTDEEMLKQAVAKAEEVLHDAVHNHDGRLIIDGHASPYRFKELDCGNINLIDPNGKIACTCYDALNAVVLAKMGLIADLYMDNALREMGKRAMMEKAEDND